MNKITQHITQPLPFIKSQWQLVVFPTLWVLLLAIVLRPFGLEYLSNKLLAVISYTSVAAVTCTIVIYAFPLLFKTYFSPNAFTIGKFYLACFSIIIIATILCCIVSYYLNMVENKEIIYSTVERFLLWFITVVFIAILPIVIVYTSLRNSKLKTIKMLLENESQFMYDQLDGSKHSVVLAKNTKEPLNLLLDKLLYIEALGNDVAVYYIKNDSIRKRQFRYTLVQITDELNDYPQIVRCHRSFVVNIQNVTLAKDTQTNQFIVNICNTRIPISRSYAKEMKEKLTD